MMREFQLGAGSDGKTSDDGPVLRLSVDVSGNSLARFIPINNTLIERVTWRKRDGLRDKIPETCDESGHERSGFGDGPGAIVIAVPEMHDESRIGSPADGEPAGVVRGSQPLKELRE